MIAKSKHARAMLLQDRRRRRTQARELEIRDQARATERELAIAREALQDARGRLMEAVPVYVRAQELACRHFGRECCLTVAFNPECIWRAGLDTTFRRHGGDVYELDGLAHWVSQDAAEKIRRTIMDEIRKQTGIPGAPYGR